MVNSQPTCPRANVVGQIALYGARNRVGWGVGLTILTALGNLRSVLPEEETYLALVHGARRVATDCAGQAPRHARAPLAASPDFATLKRWPWSYGLFATFYSGRPSPCQIFGTSPN